MVSKSLSSRMAPFVWKYIERLQQKSDHIGTCAGVTKILSEASGSGSDQLCDRFVIAFPYGAQCCKWEVIFDSSLPEEPPDFIFLNSDQNFLPEFEELRSLHKWDHNNPDCLFDSIKELVVLYKQHHMKLIASTRVEFELFSLTPSENDRAPSTSGDGVAAPRDRGRECCQSFPDSEVFVCKKNENILGPIQIGVKLPINCTGLSEVYPTESAVDKVLAIVVYENADGGNITTQICPSIRVERVLRSMGGIPHVPFPLEGCLHDYVVSVTNQINDMVDRFVNSFKKRKQFALSLASTFSSFLLEFDAVSFGRVHMLVSTEESSTLLLTIEIPQNFPTFQPTLHFASVAKESSARTVRDFPYSPRWMPEEMTERLKTYLVENVPLIYKDFHGNSATKTKPAPAKN